MTKRCMQDRVTSAAEKSARHLLAVRRTGDPHRQQPGNPQKHKIQRQKDHQARLRPKALDHEPDEIVGDVAGRHEADVVEHKLHDALRGTGIAPALLLAQDSRGGSHFARPRLDFRRIRSLPSRARKRTSGHQTVAVVRLHSERYSTNFRFAALETSVKSLMSSSITRANSAPDMPPGSVAIALSLSRTPASASARRTAASSLALIAGGVMPETNRPLHSRTLTCGSPSSDMVGTSGNSSERSAPVTAKGRIFPACTSGTVGGPSPMANKVCSEATLTIISLVLL